MGITNFQIVLDSPTGAYYAGQNVTGKLLLNLDKPKKIRGMMAKYNIRRTLRIVDFELLMQVYICEIDRKSY